MRVLTPELAECSHAIPTPCCHWRLFRLEVALDHNGLALWAVDLRAPPHLLVQPYQLFCFTSFGSLRKHRQYLHRMGAEWTARVVLK